LSSKKGEVFVKVIFLADVLNVARAGQSKEVADGYARNYLFPRKLAVLANSQAAAAVEAHLKKVAKQRALEEAEMAEVAKKIAGLEITLKAKVGENERLYGSITGADIAAALSKAAGCEIDKRKIDLAEPIKQVGACDVTVRFTHDITAVIKVNVMSEDAVEEKPAKAEKAEAEKAEKSVKEKKPKAVKSEKEEKPPKEKEAKAPKAGKEEKPAKAEEEEEPALEEKKEKKSKSKAKKTEEAAEAKKE
jgi:large subunit ribosomal protein L9